ncbi:hypothetical protein R4P64_31920 [Rhodococcus sp. IEGM 1366]|uniref:hypothetical protein n=1 Tax=Rhodococcus sp. IEGM 1366 TaxID=3082223 RepID=UPI0029535F08|nr:hypothetical protein [Rhodococcus sp. IEGM 1366]MDV8071129.1 hypothetical protein [Rhodococcus sp. IEGM 1366]
MALVVLQPAGSKESQKHYEDTVANFVALEDFTGLQSSDFEVLRAAFPAGKLQVWGATPAANGSNVKKHAKLQAGDFVLFAKKNTIFSAGTVRHTFRSEEIAEKLWTRDDDGQTWELMFAIDDVRELNIPVPEINAAVGYKSNNSIQGFTVLDADKSINLIEFLGFDLASAPTVTADPDDDELPDFKPKNDSDYLATITGHTQTKTRLHERLVHTYGTAMAKSGFVPATTVHPRDLTLMRKDRDWLVEVKVIYKGNATDAVRAVVGQLFQYQHFLYPIDQKPALVGVFSESIGEAYAEFLEMHGIRSVWNEGGGWNGSELARLEGLVPVTG